MRKFSAASSALGNASFLLRGSDHVRKPEVVRTPVPKRHGYECCKAAQMVLPSTCHQPAV
ncbi:hypothetical protein BAUCODRAFT_30830 [Baudoinia panamericana UAMH 10762]|uniref:Uncharacterized protein n=1 Tax=Baudoinia panamericana (strain UAMH 10762) TaxID=717646 RepID=M2N883_BAUPA|nr:uncharacterized protein BAUCODRAFT_30830 [Baudoinia panamericana UAMH 10762]EMD00349.1 hypothetical protein BAUCODRAFT_30830 [Baudoinia panamericana UAMH 10762]